MIQFDNNIPLAPKTARRPTKWAALAKMQPGQSFYYHSKKNTNGTYLRTLAKKNGLDVTLRYFSEPNQEYNIPAAGYRVWCLGYLVPVAKPAAKPVENQPVAWNRSVRL